MLDDNINKCKKYDQVKINFTPENEGVDKFIQSIKSFGGITKIQKFYDDSIILKMRKMLINFMN